MISRKTVLATALLLGIVVAAAYAANPHFVKVTLSRQGSNLAVCFKEAGLGGRTTLEVSVTATANYSCRTRPGNIPKAWASATKRITLSDSFVPTNSGNIQGCFTINPPPAPPDFLCPPGLVLVLDSVVFRDVVLTDKTNGISASFPGIRN